MVTVEEDGKDLPFRKVLKHQDNNIKYKYAEKYFTNKEFTKAVELYEELVPALQNKLQGADPSLIDRVVTLIAHL